MQIYEYSFFGILETLYVRVFLMKSTSVETIDINNTTILEIAEATIYKLSLSDIEILMCQMCQI